MITEFGRRLQALMAEHGNMRAVDVVARSKQIDRTGKGISAATMSQWIHGVHEPASDAIAMLSIIFDVNPLYLMCKTDDPHYDPDAMAKQADTCDLIAQCFGKQAHDLVVMYLNLNDDGKAAAFERVQELTMLDKFTCKSRATNAHTRAKSSDVA